MVFQNLDFSIGRWIKINMQKAGMMLRGIEIPLIFPEKGTDQTQEGHQIFKHWLVVRAEL